MGKITPDKVVCKCKCGLWEVYRQGDDHIRMDCAKCHIQRYFKFTYENSPAMMKYPQLETTAIPE